MPYIDPFKNRFIVNVFTNPQDFSGDMSSNVFGIDDLQTEQENPVDLQN
jgi:hypothetical protein